MAEKSPEIGLIMYQIGVKNPIGIYLGVIFSIYPCLSFAVESMMLRFYINFTV